MVSGFKKSLVKVKPFIQLKREKNMDVGGFEEKSFFPKILFVKRFSFQKSPGKFHLLIFFFL